MIKAVSVDSVSDSMGKNRGRIKTVSVDSVRTDTDTKH